MWFIEANKIYAFLFRFKVQRAYHFEDGKKVFDMKPEDIYQIVKGKKQNI